MKPRTCSFCKGTLQKGRTEFVARVKKEVVLIKNVPAYICDNCGEAYFDPEVSKKMDAIMEDFHKGKFLAHPIAAGEIEFEMVNT